MQFAIYTSTSEIDMAPDSETGTLDEGASVIIEDEETEVPIEDEETEVVIEDEETENIVGDKEEIEDGVEYEETEVSIEEPSGKEAENNERNVNDMKYPEVDECVEWNDLIDQEERTQEVFLFFLHVLHSI
jgi:hypothetical protein